MAAGLARGAGQIATNQDFWADPKRASQSRTIESFPRHAMRRPLLQGRHVDLIDITTTDLH
jgi:hypothetical protein